jgi:hypothetical protein
MYLAILRIVGHGAGAGCRVVAESPGAGTPHPSVAGVRCVVRRTCRCLRCHLRQGLVEDLLEPELALAGLHAGGEQLVGESGDLREGEPAGDAAFGGQVALGEVGRADRRLDDADEVQSEGGDPAGQRRDECVELVRRQGAVDQAVARGQFGADQFAAEDQLERAGPADESFPSRRFRGGLLIVTVATPCSMSTLMADQFA